MTDDFDEDSILSNLPDELDDESIVTLCGAIITGYSETEEDALKLMRELIAQMARFYADTCDCEACRARRRKGAH